MTLAQFKATAREQFFLLLLEPEAALAAIPKMLPADIAERRKGLAAIRNVLSAGGEISGEAAERLQRDHDAVQDQRGTSPVNRLQRDPFRTGPGQSVLTQGL